MAKKTSAYTKMHVAYGKGQPHMPNYICHMENGTLMLKCIHFGITAGGKPSTKFPLG